MKRPPISIIIPNWNGSILLKRHLPKVIASVPDAEVIVVDDSSTDDSVSMLKRTFPEVQVIRKRRGQGFASSVNAGVDAARADIVMLLNTDVEPETGFFRPLMAHFRDKKVFAVGCLEKSHEGTDIRLRGRGIGWWHRGFYHHQKGDIQSTDTDWVVGGSGVFRRDVWRILGGMDTVFDPFYWEDIDLSYRARQAGYRLVFEPKSIVHHYHDSGAVAVSFTRQYVKKIVFRNQFIFIWKHAYGKNLLLHGMWLPVRLIQAVMRGDTEMLAGFLMAFVRMPAAIRSRIASGRAIRNAKKALLAS